MKISKGLLSILIFVASSYRLEARIPAEGLPLLTPSHDPQLPPHEPDSSVLREQAVDVNLGLARDARTKTLRLPLFGGPASLDLDLQSPKVTREGSVIRSGHVAGQPASIVVLSVGKDVLIGNIATQPTTEKRADYYEIRYLGGGRHVFRQYDPSKLPPDADPTPPEVLEARLGGPSTEAPPPTCDTDPATTIDLLVVYTPAASNMAAQAMVGLIDDYVEQANISYANSGIGQRLRLVQTKEVQYTESGNPKKDRNRLKAGNHGLDEAHRLRDDFGADVVALIVEYTMSEIWKTNCGNAYLMETPSDTFESSAFAAIPRLCADRSNGLPHELGHLMGARHDWYVDKSETTGSHIKPFPYSHGYVHRPTASDPGPAFRTIMAKLDECSDQNQACDMVPYWSNPKVKFPGSNSPMGVDDGKEPSNNAQTLKETAPIVANFRCSKN